jgi:CHAD domain-containing protein
VSGNGSQHEPAGGSQVPEHLTGVSPAYQVVTAYLGRQAHALAAQEPAVRTNQPDAVHQMRVACRRLRATLRTFDSVIGGAEPERLAGELRWLGGVLGAARDAEVQADRMAGRSGLAGGGQQLEEMASRIRGHFAAAGANARDDVVTALNSPRYLELRAALDRLLAEPQPGPQAQTAAEQAIPEAVLRSYRKVSRRMRRAGRVPAGPDHDVALHQARKAAKQARYAAEAAGPVFGRDARRFARHMAGLQTVLGEHQDAVVGRELASQLAGDAGQAGESAFWYGAWYAAEGGLASGLESRGWRAWRKASRRRYRRWLCADT